MVRFVKRYVVACMKVKLSVIDVMLLCYRGSLLTRNLGDIVKKEDFVLDSEYLTTLIIAIPK